MNNQITKDGIRTDPLYGDPAILQTLYGNFDPSKLKPIEQYPIPKDKDEVKRFVAFCNYYRRFRENFAEFTKCLNDQTKKEKNFIGQKNVNRLLTH